MRNALVVLLLVIGCAGAALSQGEPKRGIAILASQIGRDYSVDGLSELISRGHFSPVVIDWAWITAHWDKTDFAKVNQLVDKLTAGGVEVAAMYRPRFLNSPTVPTQVAQDGKPAADYGLEICYSDPSARKWGISWGEKIIEKCPAIREIIIYNPLNRCQCPKCSAAAARGPNSAVFGFLTGARSAWRAKQPQAKLGLVTMADDTGYWQSAAGIIDVAHPYLIVREDADPAKNVADIKAVRSALKEKMGSCLAKIVWEEGAKTSTPKLKAIGDLTTKERIPYFVWTFDELLLSKTYDPREACQALGLDYSAIGPALKQIGIPASELIDEVARTNDFSRLSVFANADDATIDTLRVIADSESADVPRRRAAIAALGNTRSPKVAPFLARATRNPIASIRLPALYALRDCTDDIPQLRRILQDMAKNDQFMVNEPKTGKPTYPGRTAAREMLLMLPAKVPVAETLEGKRVSLVVVKDYIRLDNTGPAVANVEFERYFPVVDSEQIVLGRWVSARGANDSPVPVSVAKVQSDSDGNMIHTYKMDTFPERQSVCVMVTSLVARRERPAPKGRFAIAKPEQYPAAVRRYLSASPLASIDHPEIRKQADELLSRTSDAYELAGELAKIMKAKSYTPQQPSPNDQPDPTPTVASTTLRNGASCCASAVCCTAILRACGIPTQLTYAPAGYLHGIVRFYLQGYGWVRMDGTCGTGKLPFTQEENDLGMVRLFDMPLEMEKGQAGWAWPFLYCDESGGNPVHLPEGAQATVTMSSQGQWYNEPIPGHYESGSWNHVIASEPIEGAWKDWDTLAKASKEAVLSRQTGEFSSVLAKAGAAKEIAELARAHAEPR